MCAMLLSVDNISTVSVSCGQSFKSSGPKAALFPSCDRLRNKDWLYKQDPISD